MATIADFNKTTLDPDQETAFLKWLAQSEWFKKIADASGATTADARATLARQIIDDPNIDIRGVFAAGVTPTADDYGHLTIPDTAVLKGVDTWIKSPTARFQDAFTREFGISSDFFDPFPQRALEIAGSMNLAAPSKVSELQNILEGGAGVDTLAEPTAAVATAPPANLSFPSLLGRSSIGIPEIDVANFLNNSLVGIGLKAVAPFGSGLLAGGLANIAAMNAADEALAGIIGTPGRGFLGSLSGFLFGNDPTVAAVNAVAGYPGDPAEMLRGFGTLPSAAPAITPDQTLRDMLGAGVGYNGGPNNMGFPDFGSWADAAFGGVAGVTGGSESSASEGSSGGGGSASGNAGTSAGSESSYG